MSIIKTLSIYDFQDEWEKWEDRKDTFSYEGKKALYEYLEQYSEDTGENIELNIVALCCEYTEYNNALEAYKYHNTGTLDLEGDEDEMEQQALEWLRDNTQVIEYDEQYFDHKKSGIIIQDF